MRRLSKAALAAKEVKKDLKLAFPNTKFAVSSHNCRGGDDISITWDNGPTTKSVREISKKYQHGHFNSTEEIYEYTNLNSTIPQVSYIFESRSITDDILAQALEDAKKYADLTDEQEITLKSRLTNAYRRHGSNVAHFLFSKLQNIDLTDGYKGF